MCVFGQLRTMGVADGFKVKGAAGEGEGAWTCKTHGQNVGVVLGKLHLLPTPQALLPFGPKWLNQMSSPWSEL